jgi:hypothetical protein
MARLRAVACFILLAAGLVTTAETTSACKWDLETNVAEREFKAQYMNQPTSPADEGEATSPERHWFSVLLGGGGTVLFAGALLVTLRRPRA